MTPIFHAIAGVSAFLLFLVEPLIAKAILPWFGGTAGVWTTCMLFFQTTLLGGYAYAHVTSTSLRPRTQAICHALLLASSLWLLPIAPSERWKPSDASAPELAILGLLVETIGLPFFLLSATGPLVQVWAARARPTASPFPLYASSNLGSLLALPAYPVLVEPALGLGDQVSLWSVAYAVFALGLGALGFFASRAAHAPSGEPLGATPVAAEVRALWVALPACSSTLLLAVTNQLCQDVAAVPFLWLLPLAIYLVSFILCFASDRAYARPWYVRTLVLALAAVACAYIVPSRIPLVVAVPLYSTALFVGCMVCHGELARLRPAASALTSFYLASSAGGALGAVFVGLLAPRVFAGYWELLFGAAAILPLALLAAAHDRTSPLAGRLPAVRRTAAALGVGLLLAISASLHAAAEDVRLATRNFYGVLRVSDQEHYGHRLRTLVHGVTNHGSQFLDDGYRDRPTAYYGHAAGVGLAFARHHPERPRRVGLIGLGAGNLATYGRPGDQFRFYEINPLVISIAREEFSFLADSRADVEVVVGDARLVLERETPQGFDLLIVDAFSSDSIPIHLITREAFALYFRHLAPHGLLAVHVSNYHLDLEPVVSAAVRAIGRRAIVVESRENLEEALLGAGWILVGDDPEFFTDAAVLAASRPVHPREVPWNDDYSSLFRVLR